jgi:hypothetical protein
MPVNSSETRLAKLAERSFLKLWSYPNPFRAPGKEIADLIVVFGDDVVVFSDKATSYRVADQTVAWERWFRRAVSDSVKQLSGASRILADEDARIFVDDRASQAFPFALPPIRHRRVHLVAVAGTELEPAEPAEAWPGLTFDSAVIGAERPFCLGRLRARDRLVHVFEAKTLEILLAEFDTISDFVGYLSRREAAVEKSASLRFRELDFAMLALLERSAGAWGLLLSPESPAEQDTDVPPDLWTDAYATECRDRSRLANKKSFTIDRLIEHFHGEYVQSRTFQGTSFSFEAHEQALRKMARESRFARRIIATALFEVLDEPESTTFWASTIASPTFPGIRYVWLTYPTPPATADLDAVGRFVLDHLKDHVYVARSLFPSELIIGVALPNRTAAEALDTKSHFLVVFDGTKWTDDAQRGAEALRAEQGIFGNLEALPRHHIP